MTDDQLLKRLRSQHHDLKQGAYYTTNEDPEWDAIPEAIAEIERLRKWKAEAMVVMGHYHDLAETVPRRLGHFGWDDIATEIQRLRDRVEYLSLKLIEASNPGIDMEQVKLSRKEHAERNGVTD